MVEPNGSATTTEEKTTHGGGKLRLSKRGIARMINQASSGAYGERRRIGATRDGALERWGRGNGRRRNMSGLWPCPIYERMAQLARAMDERIREITRDHVKKIFSQAARNSWADVDRETVACRAFASGRQGPEGAPPQKPSTDLVSLAMVRGGDHLDIEFNRNRLVVSVEGRDRAAPLPVRRAPILGRTHLEPSTEEKTTH